MTVLDIGVYTDGQVRPNQEKIQSRWRQTYVLQNLKTEQKVFGEHIGKMGMVFASGKATF